MIVHFLKRNEQYNPLKSRSGIRFSSHNGRITGGIWERILSIRSCEVILALLNSTNIILHTYKRVFIVNDRRFVGKYSNYRSYEKR